MILMVFATAFYLAAFAPLFALGAASGLLRRGDVVVHPFDAGRARAVAGRAWLWTAAAVVAGFVSFWPGAVLMGELPGIGVVLVVQAAVLATLLYDGSRTASGRWSASGTDVVLPARCWVLALVTPAVVLLTGVLPIVVDDPISVLGMLVALPLPVLVVVHTAWRCRSGRTFGDWYLARRALHGSAVATYLVVLPLLAMRVLLDRLPEAWGRDQDGTSLLGGDATAPWDLALAEVALGMGVLALLFHLGRLCVLPRATGAETFTEGRTSWASA